VFRGGGFAPRDLPLAGAATLLGLIALWQVGDWLHVIPTLFLPAPIDIAIALYHLTISGELWKQLSASLARLAIGWLVGTVFGICLGLAVGLWSPLRSPGMAVVSALFPIPKIALVPLFIIWFGIGEGSKIVTLSLGVFLPTVIATAGAVDNVPRSLIRMAQSFGLSRAADPQQLPRDLVDRHRAVGGGRDDRRGPRHRRVRAVGGQPLRHRQSTGRHRRVVAAGACGIVVDRLGGTAVPGLAVTRSKPWNGSIYARTQ
jgi:hypothetical protein